MPEAKTHDVQFSEYDPVSVANRLRQAREALDLTRKQVAEKLGIPLGTMEKYETGRAEPNLSRLRKLCRFYGIPAADIMDEVGDDEGTGDPDPAPNVNDQATRMRYLLQELSQLANAPVYVDDQGEQEPTTSPHVRFDAKGMDQPPTLVQVLRELADAAGDKQVQPRQFRKQLRRVQEELADADRTELVDAMEERGLQLPEGEDDADADEDEDQEATWSDDHLRQLLTVHAVYGVDPRDLSREAINRVIEDLQIEEEQVEPLGFLDGFLSGDQAARYDRVRQLLPDLVKAARSADRPDLADRKRYPLADAGTSDKRKARGQARRDAK
jgi:transcriptional regulator with XRE-family HTH domain